MEATFPKAWPTVLSASPDVMERNFSGCGDGNNAQTYIASFRGLVK